MGEVLDCSGYFEMKQTFNRIIQDGRKIIKQGGPEWRDKLTDWKKQNQPVIDGMNFKKGPPYDK